MHALLTLVLLLIAVCLTGCNARPAAEAEGSPIEAAVQDTFPSVQVNGEAMHYVERGSGTPVILIHGAIGDLNAWGLQMDALAEDHRVIAISRRYAWPNRQPAEAGDMDCTVALHARDLVAFMREMKLPAAHLVGHSYGAMIALRMAIDRPQLVRSLVLGEPVVETVISGTARGDSLVADFRDQSDVAVAHYRAGDQEATVRQFLKSVLGSDEAYGLVPAAVRDGWHKNLVEGICIAETQDFTSLPRDQLAAIEIPALLIKGEYSPNLLRTVSDSLRAVLPHSELRELPQASHGLQGENPTEFNRLVTEFWGRVE